MCSHWQVMPNRFMQESKSGNTTHFGNVRKYEKDPPPPPPGQSDVDPASFPLKLVKLEWDINPGKKGLEKMKLSIPPAIRARYIDDPIYGAEWRDLLTDFDSKQFGCGNHFSSFSTEPSQGNLSIKQPLSHQILLVSVAQVWKPKSC